MLGKERRHTTTPSPPPHLSQPDPLFGCDSAPRPRCKASARRYRQSGFSLLEVLVALLVLSTGLLGLARLQVYSLQNNQSAAHSTYATFLAYEALDSIRANRAHAQDYAIGIDSPPSSGDSIAEQDLRSWKDSLAKRLPGIDESGAHGGSISVVRHTDGGVFHEVTVTLCWIDARWEGKDGPRTREFIVRTEI